jgi:cell division protein FtsW
MSAKTGEWNAGRPDVLIIALTVTLLVSGLVAVYSASFVVALARYGDPNYYIIRQLIWAAMGGVLMIAAIRTDYRILRPLAIPLMLGTIGVLVAVLVIGQEAGGAQRWIGVGELTVQPAEFAKLTIVIYMAAWLSSKGDSIRSMEHGLVPFVIIIGSVSLLIMMQPDMGTTLIILGITLTMFWTAGASILQMFALCTVGVSSMTMLALAEGYRMKRLLAFLDAESDPIGHGFQTLQSLIAMGNGGLLGLGLGASRSKFFYVPASHTDGVFAIIGEEMGLIATMTILGMFVLFMVRGFQIANRARDDFGSLLAVGITTWIVLQALLNIGGITRVIPLTGVPLPFLSFGGNALAAVLIGVGVLLSVSRYGRDKGGYFDRGNRRGAIVRRGKE